MQVVFTGAFDAQGYRRMTRPELDRICARVGITTKSSVTRSIDLVVVAGGSESSAKATKAHQYGIRTASYSEFMDVVRVRLARQNIDQPAGRVAPMIVADGGRMGPRVSVMPGGAWADTTGTDRVLDARAGDSVFKPDWIRREPKEPRRNAVGSTGKRALDI